MNAFLEWKIRHTAYLAADQQRTSIKLVRLNLNERCWTDNTLQHPGLPLILR